MKTKLEYIDSKFDYKTNEVIDLYVLSLRRPQDKDRKSVIGPALSELLGDDKEALLQNQTI